MREIMDVPLLPHAHTRTCKGEPGNKELATKAGQREKEKERKT